MENSLPNELIYQILLESSYDDIIKWCQVGAVFSDICDDNIFWRDKLKYDYPEYLYLYDENSDNYREHYKISMNNAYWRDRIEREYPIFLAAADTDFVINNDYEDYYRFLKTEAYEISIYVLYVSMNADQVITVNNNKYVGNILTTPSDNFDILLQRINTIYGLDPHDYAIRVIYKDRKEFNTNPYSLIGNDLVQLQFIKSVSENSNLRTYYV